MPCGERRGEAGGWLWPWGWWCWPTSPGPPVFPWLWPASLAGDEEELENPRHFFCVVSVFLPSFGGSGAPW